MNSRNLVLAFAILASSPAFANSPCPQVNLDCTVTDSQTSQVLLKSALPLQEDTSASTGDDVMCSTKITLALSNTSSLVVEALSDNDSPSILVAVNDSSYPLQIGQSFTQEIRDHGVNLVCQLAPVN